MADTEADEVDNYDEKVIKIQNLHHIIMAHLLIISSLAHPMQIKYVSVIAKPLAPKKITKKLYKLVRKAAKAKFIRRGVKEVVKALRKHETGFCIIAGDISPVDVITHLPIMCEERQVPYFYVPSKHDLGEAASTKRPTSCILVTPKEGFSEMSLYEKLKSEAKEAGFV